MRRSLLAVLSAVLCIAVGCACDKGIKSPTINYQFIKIPAGRFYMGSSLREPGNDEIRHPVILSHSFLVGMTEVTQGQWKAVMDNNPSHFVNCGDQCPVESISWIDAIKFCNRLSKKEGLSPCYHRVDKSISWDRKCTGYRLPTEAEWEYLARSGTTGPFSTGDCLSTDKANYNGNKPIPECPKGQYRETPVHVGSFDKNAWGLFDMHGNVWEWVWDWKGDYSSDSVTDPNGPDIGTYRIYRGGSWKSNIRLCRSFDRVGSLPGARYNDLGFRLARSLR